MNNVIENIDWSVWKKVGINISNKTENISTDVYKDMEVFVHFNIRISVRTPIFNDIQKFNINKTICNNVLKEITGIYGQINN